MYDEPIVINTLSDRFHVVDVRIRGWCAVDGFLLPAIHPIYLLLILSIPVSELLSTFVCVLFVTRAGGEGRQDRHSDVSV